MLIIALQWLTVAFTLSFGILALVAARRRALAADPRYLSWLFTGFAFTLGGSIAFVQNSVATLAFQGGPESDLWARYLLWAPTWNHARGVLRITFVAILVALPFTGQLSRRTVTATAALALLLGISVGALIGWQEGSWKEWIHYVRLSLSGVSLLIILGIALLVHLARDTMDRVLWVILCIYGFRVALSVLWNSNLSWIAVPGAWRPAIWTISAIEAASFAVMVGMTLYFLALDRRGVRVPALLEHLEPPPIRTFQ